MIRTAAPAARTPLLSGGVQPLTVAAVLVAATGFALAATEAPLLAVAAGLVAIAAVAIAVKPDVTTLLVVFLIYSNAVVIAVRLHGVPTFVGAAVPMLLVLPLIEQVLVQRKPLVIPATMPWLLAFIAVKLVSGLWASDTVLAWQGLSLFLIEGFVFYLLVANVVRTSRMLRRSVWALLLAGGLLGALSVHQTITGSYRDDYLGFAQADQTVVFEIQDVGRLPEDDDRAPRQGGPLGEPNRYAQLMAALLPLGLLWSSTERSRLMRTAAALVTVLIVVAVALTFSRGGAAGVVFMLVTGTALRYLRFKQVVGLVAAAVLLFVVVPGYSERLLTVQTIPGLFSGDTSEGVADNAIRSRLGENAAGLAMVRDRPLAGVGPGLFADNYRQYAQESGFTVRGGRRQAHSLLLDIAAEQGLVGLVCFLGIVWVALRDLVRARRRARLVRPELATACTAFLLAIVTYLGTGFFLHLSYIRYFWLLMALAAAASSIAFRECDHAALDPAPAGSAA